MLLQKNIFKLFWGLIIALQLLVGRFYDERLSFFNVNISIIISALFLLFSMYGLTIYKKYTISIFLQLYMLFASVLVISALYFILFNNNISNEYGQIKLLEFIFISSFIVFIILFTKDIDLLKNILLFVFCLSAFMLVAGYYISIKKNFSFEDNNRLALLGGGPIVYARWISIGVLYVIYILNLKMIFKLIYIILGLILVLFSGSKGPLIALVLSVFITYVFSNLFSRTFFRSIIFISIGCIILFFSLLYLNNKGVLPERMQQITNLAKFTTATSVISRTERYPASYDIFIDHPLGVGLGNWAYHHNTNSQVKNNLEDYPHNIFLEILNESGIFVFIIFIIILFYTIFSIFKFYKNHNRFDLEFKKKSIVFKMTNFFFAFFIFTFINSNISGDLSDNRFLFFSIASLLFLTSLETKYPAKDDEKLGENKIINE